jgi:hypothetical protein
MTPEQIQDIVMGTIHAAMESGELSSPMQQPEMQPEMMQEPAPPQF